MDTKKIVSVSLTEFSLFLTKTPDKQLAVVKDAVRRRVNGFKVKEDLYKGFREGVQTLHKERFELDYLFQICDSQVEPARKKHYPQLFAGYKKFLGRKDIEPMIAHEGYWKEEGLKIGVKPELALRINGEPQLIKLWMYDNTNKKNEIDMRRARVVHQIMAEAVIACEDGLMPCVLDVRKSKSYVSNGNNAELSDLIKSQASMFVKMYKRIEEKMLAEISQESI